MGSNCCTPIQSQASTIPQTEDDGNTFIKKYFFLL